MYLEIKIDSGNDAFAERGGRVETARLLRQIADEIGDGEDENGEGGAVFDLNGNRVGTYHFEPNDEPEDEADDAED